jgi:SSS family solute:Na+ symporter
MLVVAWLFQSIGEGGAVTVNLIVVGVLDMPLFIITIVYGLLWRRANWQGALAGFFVGGLGSVGCYLFYVWIRHMSLSAAIDPAKQIAPIVSSIVALIVTPIVSLLTTPAAAKESHLVLDTLHNAQLDEGDAHPFHLFPESFAGQAGAAAAIIGFVMFMIGVFVHGHSAAAPLAIGGMLIVLAGGMVRVYAR